MRLGCGDQLLWETSKTPKIIENFVKEKTPESYLSRFSQKKVDFFFADDKSIKTYSLCSIF
jgi:hypothetical protein